MIAALDFGSAGAVVAGRAVRPVRFAETRLAQVGAMCRLGRAASEALSTLLAQPVDLELTEPVRLGPDTCMPLLHDARVVRVRGRLADAFLVLRSGDAARLVATAYGADRVERVRSHFEVRVFDRLVHAVARACSVFCGELSDVAPDAASAVGSEGREYFEMRLRAPSRASIGVALCAQHRSSPERGAPVVPLGGVPLRLSVSAWQVSLSVRSLSSLRPGDILPCSVDSGGAFLKAGRCIVARGACGVLGDSYAFRVIESERVA